MDEVKRLKEMGCTRDMVAMQGLGYKEILDYLDGKISLEGGSLYHQAGYETFREASSSPGLSGNGMCVLLL